MGAFWQYNKIWAAQDLAFGSEEGYELPKRGALSGLLVKVTGTLVSNSTPDASGRWLLEQFIDKIQVVGDGSEDIVNLTGLQAMAASYFDHKSWGLSPARNYASAEVWCEFLIPFGRYIWDPIYGLNLDAWNSLRVQISNICTSTQWTTDLAVDIYGLFFRDVPESHFRGYYKRRQHNKWTTSQAGYNYVTLPTRGHLRRLILQGMPAHETTYEEKTNFTNLFRNVKISLRSGQQEIYDDLLYNLLGFLSFYRGYVMDHAQEAAIHNTDKGYMTRVGYPLGFASQALSRAGSVATAIATLKAGENFRSMVPEGWSTTQGAALLRLGVGPQNCVEIPFDVPPYGDLGVDLQEERDVEVAIQAQDAAAAASGTDYVITDILVT